MQSQVCKENEGHEVNAPTMADCNIYKTARL